MTRRTWTCSSAVSAGMANSLTGRPWRRTARLVLERDDWVCHVCGQAGATTVDHLVPRHLGGTDDLSNLAAAHLGCNSRKGARVPLPRSRLATPTP